MAPRPSVCFCSKRSLILLPDSELSRLHSKSNKIPQCVGQNELLCHFHLLFNRFKVRWQKKLFSSLKIIVCPPFYVTKAQSFLSISLILLWRCFGLVRLQKNTWKMPFFMHREADLLDFVIAKMDLCGFLAAFFLWNLRMSWNMIGFLDFQVLSMKMLSRHFFT